MTYDFDEMDTKSLKKIIVNHNKQYKAMLYSLKGGRKEILPLVEKNFRGKAARDGKSVDVVHKDGLSKYKVYANWTDERKEEDAKFKESRAKDLSNRAAKVLRNKAKAKTADKKSQRKGAKKGVVLAKALSKVKGIREKVLTGATRMRLKKTGGKLTGKVKLVKKLDIKTGKKTFKKTNTATAREKKALAAKKRKEKAVKAAKALKSKRAAAKKIQKAVRSKPKKMTNAQKFKQRVAARKRAAKKSGAASTIQRAVRSKGGY